MSATLAQRIIRQEAALAAARLPHETYWDELGQICLPRGGTIQAQRSPETGRHPDRRRVAENFDGTAMRSCATLATGQAARITPMGARWFMLRPPPRMAGDQAALNWFARCTEILETALGTSNFYNRAHQVYLERGAYGIAAIETTSGPSGRGLHFRAFPVGSYAIAENSADEVDTFFRSYLATPAQLAEMFPTTCPPAVAKLAAAAETRHQQSERVIHAVYPRADRDPRLIDGANKPIASVHVHAATETVLLESGFDSMPVACTRWQSNPLSPYGWGPGDYALPESTQANFLEEMLDVLAETAAFPRILYPAGMKDEIDFAPMGLTSFDPMAPGESAQPREWLTGGSYDIGKDRLNDKKRAIEQAFFVELFQAVMRLPSTATATQVSAIVNESRELFHPIFANMTREFLTPVLRRSFALLLQQGHMPPPPASVIEADDLGRFIADPEVEYVSAMAMALEQTQAGAFSEVLTILSPLAQLDPTFLEALNPDTVLPHFIRAKGLPVDFLRSPEELAAIRAARAQQAQAMQAAQASQAVRNLGGVDETARAAEMLSQASPA